MVKISDLYKQSGDQKASQQWSRRLISFLPLGLLIAFLILLVLLFGERFMPASVVQLESVITQRSQTVAPSADAQPNTQDAQPSFDGNTLFQASGWIEADPLPIRVAALNDGFVETVHVLEGDNVSKGQLIVKLVDDDARLDLASAQSTVGEGTATLTEMHAMVRATHAEVGRLKEEVEIEQARLEELRDDQDRLNSAGSQSVSEQEIAQSRLRVLTQQAVIKALEAKHEELQADLSARSAAVLGAQHELQSAKTDLERKQLALDRMTIRSPIDGVIQQLFVSPGVKRFAMMDDPESATIAKLFIPAALQARIDVPLEEAAQLRHGQLVRLRCVFLPDRIFEGRVTRIEGQADLQRNTLQAKVEFLSPADGLRPEMLCRAEFLAPTTGQPSTAQPGSNRATVYVSADAVFERAEQTYAWTLDATGKRIRTQAVRLESEQRDGYYKVIEGLKPGDRVVIHPPEDLQEGDRIRPRS